MNSNYQYLKKLRADWTCLGASRGRIVSSLNYPILCMVLLLSVNPGSYRPALSATPSKISTDPSSLYGDKIYYTIKRNGKKIGKHTIEFNQQGKEVIVSITSALTVTVLKIPVYRFRYTSDEVWRDGQLQNVIASTTEKGKTSTVSMQRLGNTMVLQNAKGEIRREPVRYSSNHWNPGVLSADRLFNTLTAKANKIEIKDLGNDTLDINNQAVKATHYRYSGELRVDVWYDDKSRWVKLSFAGSDGSNIEYLSDGFTGRP